MKNKRLVVLSILFASAISAFSATATKNPNFVDNKDGTVSISNIDKDPSVKYKQKNDGFQNVTVVAGSKIKKNNPITVDLSDLGGKEVYLNFSCDIKVVDTENGVNEISWMINDLDSGMPEIAHVKVASGEWASMSGEAVLILGQNKSLYISGAGLNKANLTFYIKNLVIKFSGDGISESASKPVYWADAPSLKEAYKDLFDYFGIACGYRDDLRNPEVLDVLPKHVSSITMGNEFKPDFVFAWQRPSTFEDFVADDGNTYKVPMGMPSFGSVKDCLAAANDMNVKIRGHVLVWHSQTPAWFFKVDYDDKKEFVDAATMTARQEWYIKSVMEYVYKWEGIISDHGRLVTTWDVVNEAVSDGAGSQKWLREDSNWYRIYQNEDFILNAFRFANKYAPKDVLLVYNDYNCYTPGKCAAICNLIDEIKATPGARIDAIGMQSHVQIGHPAVTGHNSYEEAVQKFLEKGIDVQVTELDIANGSKPYSSVQLKAKYREYFNLFLAYRKTAEKNGISGVTIWGISDKGTWLNDLDQYKGHVQYPLLFDEEMNAKPAFFGVLEAAENYNK